MNVLFTNAGRRTYMVEFALALERAGTPLRVHVSDCTTLSASMHVSPLVRTHLLPPVTADPEAYLEALFVLAAKASIEVIFPLSDLDPLLLARNLDRFRAIGCIPVVAAPAVVERCDDKQQTFLFCREAGLPTPESWFEAANFTGGYPVIQKRIFGSGSVGLKRVDGPANLDAFVAGRDMLQAFVDGDEFGLDLLNDLDGKPVAVCVKQKLLMRAGETDKARVVRDARLEELGWHIARKFGHVGNLDCDVMRARDGTLYCIDFNARFGGGYPTTHLAGFNYLAAIIGMVGRHPVSLPPQPQEITVMKGISLHWIDNP